MSILADEITNDPLARDYASMTDEQVADDLNTSYRPLDEPAEAGALFNYLAKETAKDDAAEPAATAIYGRLQRVHEAGNETAEAAGVASQVFGTDPEFSNLTPVRLDACRTLLAVAEQDRLQSLSQIMTEQKFVDMLDNVRGAGVMKPADVTAIQGLSQNTVTRAYELGLSRVRAGTVAQARAE